ncbi:hypothetical protein E8E15_004668 [Penicillium rubens]|nr:hypothetical protein E8E15_004668 [Penicillium rubens]
MQVKREQSSERKTQKHITHSEDVEMSICALTPSTTPLHQFRLNMGQDKNHSTVNPTEFEFELPERLDLGVSEKGVIGRQVTVREQGGSILGMGIVGYN